MGIAFQRKASSIVSFESGLGCPRAQKDIADRRLKFVNKKSKVEKRHIVVDSNGLVLALKVTSASVQDKDAPINLFQIAKEKYKELKRFFAFRAYSGKLQNQCFLKTGCLLSIARKIVEKGFAVIPKRWIVERTFSWFNDFRRA
jgi:putative transposase